MPKLNLHRRDYVSILGGDISADKLEQSLNPHFEKPHNKITPSPYLTEKNLTRRWDKLARPELQSELLDPHTLNQMHVYEKNIEHFIGTVKLPVGLAGPLRVNGLFANDDYLVPLATTEAALVASYNRGAQLLTASGGASAMLLNEGVTRTPAFAFFGLAEAGQFVAWAVTQYDTFKQLAESTTSHGKLSDINISIEGNHVYLVFEFLTGDASGQNMVTIATNAVFNYIMENSPITPENAYLDGNLSGDKKASSQTLRSVRGKKVTAEAHIPAELVKKYLHTTPEKMMQFTQMSTVGATLSGTIGINAHYANALAALYIACGQDAACVAESAIGMTRIEVDRNGDLYASVTLPNLMLGTVGGGTGLPSQKACLELMGLHGAGKSQALAEVCAALCLAGELSIVGAFCAGHFSRAHHKLAR
ncbi:MULTISPECIES: hydroxymethylglutaryl-CoA reductase [Aliivibrio]|uniref:hydroxymethylglutaryl-CoA reductase n=1 Tax=Aliivibrio TaxID=511678 RepID=UPI00080EE15C|nr:MULTISPECIES: hydroxymethylglutaryl-CoA reductase [Aliivibrio]MBD1569436.1 hydroxymethylglutaryl-CoA reductase [Aliivibrio sp. S10_S31]OCH07512.1 3-hydroxy-3-methylglutaryl-CoA reductase [Aliivibrio fischeri]OCH27683.1 3-hydroxy-3-methylglutaryl-CoA reductase [Aliivibrio fischeri]OCH29241.1 3-hydroxy-3-methylglutaryl-CoA reductase [Aliivibrio fischeri]OCH62361.1 3-hydroxy-3-methylglutaryl-CoA reductase [Aliivibrio fischeri]